MITTPKDYTPIFGLRLQIQRRGRGKRSCHAGVVRICTGTNGHAADLLCVACGLPRGWLGYDTAKGLLELVAHFPA
jgi:hypothetical protein